MLRATGHVRMVIRFYESVIGLLAHALAFGKTPRGPRCAREARQRLATPGHAPWRAAVALTRALRARRARRGLREHLVR